jgi:hypothetical protein
MVPPLATSINGGHKHRRRIAIRQVECAATLPVRIDAKRVFTHGGHKHRRSRLRSLAKLAGPL